MHSLSPAFPWKPSTRGFFVTFGMLTMLSAAAAAQQVRSGELRSDVAARVASFGGASAGWILDATNNGAVVRIIGDLPVAGSTAEGKARDFISKYGELFDIDGSMIFEFSPAGGFYKNGAPRAVAAKQTARGFIVSGRSINIILDPKGNVTAAHGSVSRGAAALASPVFSEHDALVFARARLLLLGLDSAGARAGSERVEKIVKYSGGAERFIYKVSFVMSKDWTPLAFDVDARTGETIRIYENRSSGTGNFHFNGDVTTFKTGSGKGNVYANVSAALSQKHSAKPLAELGFETIATTPGVDGTLFGRYSVLVDAGAADAFSQTHIFGFNSNDLLDKDLFDQVNAYYWIEQHAVALAKIFGPLPTDYSLPVVVNVPVLENAFFSPADAGFGFGPGFMLFGDPSQQTGDPMDDYSRDMSVAGHEYFHAVADGIGLQFGNADTDNPPRAVNEAVADYFSTSFFNDPRVGRVISKFHFGPDLALNPDALRDLSEERVFPHDLTFLLGTGGLPEEHEAGLIFGATLWRFRTILKKKVADDVIADTLATWPQSTADVGFAVVDTNNAQAAYAAYYKACLSAVLDRVFATRGSATGGKALGAVLVNGAIGNAAEGTEYFIDATAGLTLNYDSIFLNFVDDHTIKLNLAAGQKIDITVTGNGADHTGVDFELGGLVNDFTFPKPKTVTGSNSKVAQKQITVANAGAYNLKLQNVGAGPGRYKLQLKVK